MIRLPEQVCSLVMEASSKEDQTYMRNMNKHDIHQINGQAIQNLYDKTIQRSNINFGDIPDSNGDIEKCKYYESTVQCLDIIDELHKQNNINDDTVMVVKDAISHMIQFKPRFAMGFKMKHEYIMLTYNSLVLAIIDTTTMLIRSYMDYIVTADLEYNLNTKKDNERGIVTVSTLKAFNQACENGTMAQSMTYMIDSGAKSLVGENVVITGVVIMALLSIVPIMRELIYFYYHTRVKLSDYLKMQSDFLEMNKLAVQASTRPPQERKQIVKKQEKVIHDLRRLSDKIMIDHVDTNDVVKKEVKDESSIFSLSNVEKQISKNKLMNNDIMIL